ncbi:NUDIX domain-containing protein [Streptomyces mirabilis]|uniref:NUDIX hydrolase n=1 Tax=Streptomyces sp. NPDC005388 TaxID=3156717 RepID=UPI0033B07DF3
MPSLQLREAARVIVLDSDNRVLLLSYAENGGFWATPGGSLEPGETYQAAALRELREELGVTEVSLGPELAVRTKEHLVGGKPARQVERYFVTVVAPGTVDSALATQPDAIRAWRWWTITDIRETSQTIYPAGLANLVSRFLQDGPPSAPAELG